MIQARVSPHSSNGAQPSEHESEAADVKAEHAQWIYKEVHRHRMGDVLGSGKACFHHGETRLHEHDKEPCHKRPYKVYGNLIVTCRSRYLFERRLSRGLSGYVRYCAGVDARRIRGGRRCHNT